MTLGQWSTVGYVDASDQWLILVLDGCEWLPIVDGG